MTPMGFAASRGELKICQWLYANGARSDVTVSNKSHEDSNSGQVNLTNNEEDDDMSLRSDVETIITKPMYLAVCGQHLDVVKWLFDHGASGDVTCRSINEGFSPLSTAMCLGITLPLIS